MCDMLNTLLAELCMNNENKFFQIMLMGLHYIEIFLEEAYQNLNSGNDVVYYL